MSRGFDVAVLEPDSNASCCRMPGSSVPPETGFTTRFDATGSPAKVLVFGEVELPPSEEPQPTKPQLVLQPHQLEPQIEFYRDIGKELDILHEKCASYRRIALKKHQKKQQMLSDAFLVKVLTRREAARLSLDTLMQKLGKWEHNDVLLSALKGKLKPALQHLLQVVAPLARDPIAAFWYCFWDSLWTCNRGLPVIERNAALLDPTRPGAIATAGQMERHELVACLRNTGLIDSVCGLAYISPGSLDALYGALSTVQAMNKLPNGEVWAWLPYAQVQEQLNMPTIRSRLRDAAASIA